MMHRRAFRHFAAFAAMLGIVLQVFWPLLAQAHSGSGLYTTICSVGGIERSVEIPGVPPADQSPAKQVKHCPLCSGSDRSQAILEVSLPVLAVPAAPVALPAEPALPSFRSTVVSPAQARAPPVQS